jgi:hypothetical protein
MIKPHKFGIGPLTMILGIVNAAFGFKFALAGGFNLVYVPIVIAVLILLVIGIVTKRFFMGRRKKSNGPMGFGEAGAPPVYGSGQPYGGAPFDAPPYGGPPAAPYGSTGYDTTRSDIALTNMGQPPSYSQQAAKPREMI